MWHKGFVTLLTFAFIASAVNGQDTGVPDSVLCSGGTLIVGQSLPLDFYIVNDVAIEDASLGFISTTIDGGFARYDSTVFVGRMSDPSVLPLRIVNPYDNGGVSPDTVIMGLLRSDASANRLPVGNGICWQMYFTGLTVGEMSIDSGYFPPAGQFLYIVEGGLQVAPAFACGAISIQEGALPLQISFTDDIVRTSVGNSVTFTALATDPNKAPLTLSIRSVVSADDDTIVPSSMPAISGGNPATISWTPTAADIGIWTVTVEACDIASTCVSGEVQIQVVESDLFLVEMSNTVSASEVYPNSIIPVNLDTDPEPEIYFSASGYNTTPVTGVYNLNADLTLSLVSSFWDTQVLPKYGGQIGFFDGDDKIDAVLSGGVTIPNTLLLTMKGLGGNQFDPQALGEDVGVSKGAAIGEFTGDGNLDYVVGGSSSVRIIAGNGLLGFNLVATIDLGEEVRSVNVADLNNDGNDDLIVGTVSGIQIMLGDGALGFTNVASYSQSYGSQNIDVTNQGSDFNNDGIFDLCVATPSIGQVASEIVVYFGNGDGTFNQQVTRTVKGQAFANCAGDFNGDGQLDIAYINGATKQVGILFGDGNGQFTNELRYSVSGSVPNLVACMDADLDGDLDLVVSALATGTVGSLVLMSNQTDPAGLTKSSIALAGEGNVEVKLQSATGHQIDRVKNSISSGSFHRRNLSGSNRLDDFISIETVENGEYRVSASLPPNNAPGQLFTLEFSVDGKLYRLAKDLAMPVEGYVFPVFLSGTPDVFPSPGTFAYNNPPILTWQGTGTYNVQIATDPEFTNVVAEALATGNSFTPSVALGFAGDTATFYWHYQIEGDTDYGDIYVLNLVASGAGCGDVDGLGNGVNISDIVYLVAYLFQNGPPPPDMLVANVDGLGGINVSDITYLVAYLFQGGPPAVCP